MHYRALLNARASTAHVSCRRQRKRCLALIRAREPLQRCRQKLLDGSAGWKQKFSDHRNGRAFNRDSFDTLAPAASGTDCLAYHNYYRSEGLGSAALRPLQFSAELLEMVMEIAQKRADGNCRVWGHSDRSLRPGVSGAADRILYQFRRRRGAM